MKMFMKISCVAALALVMTTLGASKARAGGWVVAGGVSGGVAVGTAGVAVSAPVYCAPAPVTVAVAPSYYCAPRVVCGAPYPYCRPYFRAGYGWGPHYHYYGGHYFRR
jgi:hypothetical protein